MLEVFQLSEVSIDFVVRVFTDCTGVQQDDISRFWRICKPIPAAFEDRAHQLRVVHVHLAAEGLDVYRG